MLNAIALNIRFTTHFNNKQMGRWPFCPTTVYCKIFKEKRTTTEQKHHPIQVSTKQKFVVQFLRIEGISNIYEK